MINISCVLRKGGKVGYDSSWVEKLYNSISRNVSLPFRFVCLSDCEVPVERIKLDPIGEGYWAKLQLFRKDLFDGPVLFFDLDTVICQNIDLLIKNCLNQKNFLMWKDPDYNISSSAIMYWNGDYSYIYENFIENTEYYMNRYSPENQGKERLIGDQAVISSLVEHSFINDHCPNNWIKVMNKNPRFSYEDSRILIFRKSHTKPSTMSDHPLVKAHWN